MYASYRYSIRKAIAVKSTWLILLIAIALMIGLAGILPFNIQYRRFGLSEENKYLISMYVSYAAGVGTILTLIIAVFAGFKGAAMFRDEIEDGSLLIMLSKPITRSALIFSKWLGYMTVLVVFCFVVSLSHAFGIGIGTKFHADAGNIFKGIFLELAFALIFSLIFAGLALFFSTFLSATQTAVTVLVFGVLSPLTSVIQPVTSTSAFARTNGSYNGAESVSMSSFLAYRVRNNDGTVSSENSVAVVNRLAVDSAVAIIDSPAEVASPAKRGVYDMISVMNRVGLLNDIPASAEELDLSYVLNLFARATDPNNPDVRLASFIARQLSTRAPDADAYLPLRIIDFNGQASALSDYVTDAIFSSQTISGVASLTNGRIGQQVLRSVVDVPVTKDIVEEFYDAIAAFSPPPSDSTAPVQISEAQRQDQIDTYFNANPQGVYTLTYVRYINKDYVLIAYVLIAVALTPVALIILRYKNIR